MQLARPAFAPRPSAFGRRPARELTVAADASPDISPELKLFAMTFLAGFVFVSVLIA